jgi:hypothetical protein
MTEEKIKQRQEALEGLRLDKKGIEILIPYIKEAGFHGETIHSFCTKNHITYRNLCKAANRSKALRDALEDMKAAAKGYWENMMFMASAGVAKVDNPSALIFTLKNIAGWRDKKDVEMSGGTYSKIEVVEVKGNAHPKA